MGILVLDEMEIVVEAPFTTKMAILARLTMEIHCWEELVETNEVWIGITKALEA